MLNDIQFKVEMIPRVAVFCDCCPLETGVTIIGVLELLNGILIVGYFLIGGLSIPQNPSMGATFIIFGGE